MPAFSTDVNTYMVFVNGSGQASLSKDHILLGAGAGTRSEMSTKIIHWHSCKLPAIDATARILGPSPTLPSAPLLHQVVRGGQSLRALGKKKVPGWPVMDRDPAAPHSPTRSVPRGVFGTRVLRSYQDRGPLSSKKPRAHG